MTNALRKRPRFAHASVRQFQENAQAAPRLSPSVRTEIQWADDSGAPAYAVSRLIIALVGTTVSGLVVARARSAAVLRAIVTGGIAVVAASVGVDDVRDGFRDVPN
jgi:hypothetical protein